jgi:hypothetical protein
MSIFTTQVARSTPFDVLNNSIKADNVQEAFEELRKQTVYEPQYTTLINNTIYSLTSDSSTLQFFTGTGTNTTVRLPNATTLANGHSFILANESSSAVAIQDGSNNALAELLSDSIAYYFLQDNGNAAGTWVGFVVSGFATGILSYTLSSEITFSTTSTTDVIITGFSLLPVAGRYSCWFNANISSGNNSSVNYYSIYRGGVKINDSERIATSISSGASASTLAIVNVNGSQAVDVRVRRSANTLTVESRTLLLIRLGPEL